MLSGRKKRSWGGSQLVEERGIPTEQNISTTQRGLTRLEGKPRYMGIKERRHDDKKRPV